MKRNLFLLISSLIMLGWACSSTRIASGNTDPSVLEGRWELSYIAGTASNEAYPGKMPFINFSIPEMRVSGNTSCNSFSGPLMVSNDSIDFNQPFILTKMFCEGGGETRFLETLEKIRTFRVVDGTSLEFYAGDSLMMRFVKRQ